MGDSREPGDEHADGRLWARGATRVGGDHHTRPVSVVLYGARHCHLCERARATLAELRVELGFELAEVDITGDPELEGRFRELLPVVEIDGEQAFIYFVQPDALRRKLTQARP